MHLRVSARRDSVFNEQLTQIVLIERLRKLFEIMAARNSFLKDEVGTGYVRSGVSLYLEPMFGFYLEESDSEHIPECSDTADYKSLPELDFITRLQLRDKSTILPLGSGFLLSSRLPKLHAIELETSQRPGIWYSKWLHIDDRRHLERAITDTDITDKFRSGQFTLNIWARDDYERTTPSLEVVFDDALFGITRPSYDPMSMSIRNFSQNLTSLNLSANLNASIFWPQPHEPDDNKNSIPHWPHLRHLTVRLGVARSDGTYYFQHPDPPSRGGPDVVPREESMQELFSSWAKALSRMPRLESATLWFRIRKMVYLDPPHLTPQVMPNEPIKWIVGFHAPGVIPDPKVHSCLLTDEWLKRPRLTFEQTEGWIPEMTTMESLYRMAESRFPGKELVHIQADNPFRSHEMRMEW
ncbi:hypothetical protein KJ359_008950 [Pestalotiopsis sp. 9143b]|nr:hypothetical protein KJ359_008950 [Pestalotiopsis sp. 9143b]